MVLKEELQRTNMEWDSYKEKIKENQEKIKLNKQLPYLVGNIVEVILSFSVLIFILNVCLCFIPSKPQSLVLRHSNPIYKP